ncbi:diguanylate cyclase domain-containing protein [Novosphingobium sp.]|uniref:diguanylate cyclase domain-containing protein n=1 Tax=Novosphingobium sp. TaxID=1874826 RepID=UPI00286BFFFE|nr:diguanylate cyclase [Novosphingobium sp.]
MTSARLPTLRLLLSRVHLQLIIFAVVLATASLMLSGAMVIHNYMATNLRLAADTVAYSAEPAMVFQDNQAMTDAIGAVAGYPSVDRVELRDNAGRSLASWTRAHGDARGWLVRKLNAVVWPRPTAAVVSHSGEKIGDVLVYGNSGGILRFIAAGLVIALACIGLSVVGTRILARHLQQGVIGPLEQVARVAHEVREQRAFEKRVPASGIAEIDRLGQDFNALLAELQAWQAGMLSENAELKRRARHDELTGLGNRALFEKTVQTAIESGLSLALIHVDIDGFKAFNAVHGIESGDAALIAVAQRLRSVLRGDDAAFRIGGDEFAVLLLPAPEGAGVDAAVDWIRVAMDDAVRLPDGTQARIELAIGQARHPQDGATIGELLSKADSGMHPRNA